MERKEEDGFTNEAYSPTEPEPTSKLSRPESVSSDEGNNRRLFCCAKPKDETEEVIERTSFRSLFRFADKLDVFLMLSGTLALIGLGALAPINSIFIGGVISEFVYFETPVMIGNLTTIQFECAEANGRPAVTQSAESVVKLLTSKYIPTFASVALSAFISAYYGLAVWTWTSERQIRRARCVYFEAVMRQSIGWFDVHNSGELNSRMIEDIGQYRTGLGENMANLIKLLSLFVTGYVVGLSISWKLTLVMFAFTPLCMLCFALFAKVLGSMTQRQLAASAKAAAVAEEVFSSIRTVAAFGGERRETERYSSKLRKAFKLSVRKEAAGGCVMGFIWMIIFAMNGVAIRYGITLLQEDCLAPGAIITVFISVFLGTMSLAQAGPTILQLNNARAATADLFKVIDAHVEIDISSDEGYKPEILEGTIEFDEVDFFYPTRPEVKVLNNLSCSVKKGETVALVGESGCGKSTTIQLIQRFYDCTNGKVFIDGKDLREYNLACLRNFMGIVSQEPVLFATTIGENIRLGAKWGEEVTQEQIETAARQSNCYDFISNLPKGFDTLVGERGVQLSGGQKQRIAIARALIRNPAILLLDEATSALDTQSEAIVQDALEKASEGRTTIVIAHRLSTVKGANKIFAFKDGQVHEQGTHNELMSMEGIYYSLVMRQLQRTEEAISNENESNAFSPSRHEDVDIKDIVVNNLENSTSKSQKVECSSEEEVSEPGKETNNEDGVCFTPDISTMEIWRMSKPEWGIIVLEVICSVIYGSTLPIYAVLYSLMVGEFSEPDVEKQLQRSTVLVGLMIVLGLVTAAASTSQAFFMGLAGEKLTTRLREQVFNSLTRREIGFFDDEKHSVGLLTSKLSSEASLVKGALVVRLGLIAQGLATSIGVLLVIFLTLWEVAFLVLVIVPFIVVSGKVRASGSKGSAKQDKERVEEGGKIAHAAISNMRTVTSINKQKYFTEKFFSHFKKLYKVDLKKSLRSGATFGLSESIFFVLHCLFFGFGGYLLSCQCIPWRSEPIRTASLIRLFGAVAFSSLSVGRVAADLPDLVKAKLMAASIKSILQEKSKNDPESTEGTQPNSVDGDIEFTDVEFTYPTRKEVQVLQGLNFNVKKGETLALVGSSGCGKSTTVSLLERFYDAVAGGVSIDGRDVKELNLQWLRRHLGIVSQEPTLFDATIAENIAYGDNTRDVSMTEIIDAATQANVHNFISDLPKGYETTVGAKGTQLSGGQKQRVAIARALVRNPAILLLDEATSALDAESEKLVQEALDKALKGRTAIIIAHRLSTIRNADKIGVIDNGKIVEMGTHQQLLDKKEYYFNLINTQL